MQHVLGAGSRYLQAALGGQASSPAQHITAPSPWPPCSEPLLLEPLATPTLHGRRCASAAQPQAHSRGKNSDPLGLPALSCLLLPTPFAWTLGCPLPQALPGPQPSQPFLPHPFSRCVCFASAGALSPLMAKTHPLSLSYTMVSSPGRNQVVFLFPESLAFDLTHRGCSANVQVKNLGLSMRLALQRVLSLQ